MKPELEWIKKWEKPQSLVNNERILEYLERLDTVQGNPIHITA